MKDQKNRIEDNKAFEDLLVQTMHNVGHEQDTQRIAAIEKMNEEDFRQMIANLRDGGIAARIPVAANIPAADTAASIPVVPKHPRIWQYAAAACITSVLLFGGATQYWAYNQTTALGTTSYALIPSDGMQHMRGGNSDETVVRLQTLFAHVETGKDLQTTIVELEKAYQESADESSDYNDVRNSIAWNLAMAYLKNGDRKAARPILETIIEENEPDKLIVQQAQRVLDEINAIFSLW